MFEILTQSNDRRLVVRAMGKLTVDDYEKTLIPKLNELFKHHEKINMLVDFADDFSGWETTAAAWDDMKLGLQYAGNFSRFAIVGAPEWVAWGARFYGFFIRGEIRQFETGELTKALDWLENSKNTKKGVGL
jgi:hypothetical protein